MSNALILDLIQDILGEVRYCNEGKGQYTFDCPVCSYHIKQLDKGDGKGNFEVNIPMGVFKCWACCETHYTHGSMLKMVSRYGNKDHLKDFKLYSPESFVILEKDTTIINDVPKYFKPLTESNDKRANEYIKKRGIKDYHIQKFNIGYCDGGEYSGRIVIPSYDDEGKVDYFISRSYVNHKMKYKNPEKAKQEVIFNYGKINWDSTITLVEGVFDSIVVPNSIALLGKILYDKLLEEILENAEGKVLICLDSDANLDAIGIYKKINSGRLRGRVRVCKIPDGYDISDIYRVMGSKGVVNVLRKSYKLKDSVL